MARFSRSTNIARLRSRSLFVMTLKSPHAAPRFGTGRAARDEILPPGRREETVRFFPPYADPPRYATGEPTSILARRAGVASAVAAAIPAAAGIKVANRPAGA